MTGHSRNLPFRLHMPLLWSASLLPLPRSADVIADSASIAEPQIDPVMPLARHQRVKRAFLGAAPASGAVIENVVCCFFLLEIQFRSLISLLLFDSQSDIQYTIRLFFCPQVLRTSVLLFSPLLFLFVCAIVVSVAFEKHTISYRKQNDRKYRRGPCLMAAAIFFCRFVVF